MNTKTLSTHALSVIDQYLHLKVGSAVCSVPYFNNKTIRSRGSLSVLGGKGSPQEIFEEAKALSVHAHIDINALADESLKKLLVDNNIGIDCSGFAYYILDAESRERSKGSLDKHISFTQSHGLLRKLIAHIRPVQNTDVATFTDEHNSRVLPVSEIQPGDFISLTNNAGERDHMLIVHQVEYQNFIPYKIQYSHTVAYPEDGVYGTGIRQGTIDISDSTKLITEAVWTENGKAGPDNRMYMRALKSKTEIRRLKWW